MNKQYNPYEDMLEVLDEAAKLLGYDEHDYITVKYPERELKVSIPVKMDDGTIQVFEGYQYSIWLKRTLQRRYPLP